MRRSLLLRVVTNPDLHRHAQSTFKDGHHRAAPQPNFRAWIDPKSPFYRGWDWAMMPVNRLSVIAAWSIATVVGYYCWCIQYDLRGVYGQNQKLQRQLHLAHARAQDSEARLASLQPSLVRELQTDSHSGANLSHEMELTRERARVSSLVDRNNTLVRELAEIRGDLATARKENATVSEELVNVRKLLKSLSS
jgi:CRISPR/Cas system-associated exonuclease Cas4 (RecB family)